MRTFSNLMVLTAMFVAFLLLSASLASESQLIEPTRTLEGEEKPPGRLLVFSEPPGLDVMLDETEIGPTPAILDEVEPGMHNLRIKDSETEIYVGPGESLKISFYKGSFIKIPEEKKEAEKKPGIEKPAEKEKVEEPSEEEIKYEPFYWPLDPQGPIYPP